MNNNEDIEVLDENIGDFTEFKNDNNSITTVDTIFSEDNTADKVKEKTTKNKNTILKIQIGLIIFLIMFALLFYFFGYELVEPYIKV